MAFHISVYRKSDDELFVNPPEDVNSLEFEQWEARCLARTLYDNPLGSDDTVYHYWSTLAEHLGLPLISEIYTSGLRLYGADLSRLEKELDRLERHWETLDMRNEPGVLDSTLSEEGRIKTNKVAFLDHLRERIGYLREAIRIAKASDGVVCVS
jgi:hypothetical protein